MLIWYDMIWYDMIWYDMIWYDMIWYDMDMDMDMIWYDMIYDMIYDFIGIALQPKGRIASYKQTNKNTIYKQRQTIEKSKNHTKGRGNVIQWCWCCFSTVYYESSGVATRGGVKGQSWQRKIDQKSGKRVKKSGKSGKRGKIGKVLSLCPSWQIGLAMLLHESPVC